ncbi:hypothetical protein HPSH_00895 [Helicobacter pylori Shi470]|nr:hypothetical protein HPSH_00895 [Helicobacter pylori Shi470]
MNQANNLLKKLSLGVRGFDWRLVGIKHKVFLYSLKKWVLL